MATVISRSPEARPATWPCHAVHPQVHPQAEAHSLHAACSLWVVIGGTV